MKRLITRDKSFYKSLVFLAIPIALQNLITFAVGFADNVMIGALGDAAVSGVYVGGQIQAVLQMVIGGIEGAIMILGAQYWGRKDLESIRKVTAIGLRFAMIVGLIFTIVFSLFAEPVVHLFTSDPDAVREGTSYLRIVAFSYIFFDFRGNDRFNEKRGNGTDRHVYFDHCSGREYFAELGLHFRTSGSSGYGLRRCGHCNGYFAHR